MKQKIKKKIFDNSLKGKNVLVTGASSGFGKAIAERFILAGAKVIIAARRIERLKSFEKKYNKKNLHIVNFDIRNKEEIYKSINQLPQDLSKIDILINNAGLARGLSSANIANLDDWEEMVDTNCKGLMYITRIISEGMVQRKSGHIINIGSVAGTYPYFGSNIYGATKAFVHQFSLNLRADLADKNIRVTCVEPGAAKTEFSLVRFHGNEEKAKATYDGLEPITPENIAEIVEFVAISPSNININKIEVMSNQQSFAGFNFIRNNSK